MKIEVRYKNDSCFSTYECRDVETLVNDMFLGKESAAQRGIKFFVDGEEYKLDVPANKEAELEEHIKEQLAIKKARRAERAERAE